MTRCFRPPSDDGCLCGCVPPLPVRDLALTWRRAVSDTHQNLIALRLSPDETTLAIHHVGAVELHHVARFMAGEKSPSRTLCAGQKLLQFEWRVTAAQRPRRNALQMLTWLLLQAP